MVDDHRHWPLWLWSGDGGSWHFITVPEELSRELRSAALADPRGFRSVRIDATVNGISWQTSVFSQKSGGYILPVKAKVRAEAGIAGGDTVTVFVSLRGEALA